MQGISWKAQAKTQTTSIEMITDKGLNKTGSLNTNQMTDRLSLYVTIETNKEVICNQN